jgi:hypothetical protein
MILPFLPACNKSLLLAVKLNSLEPGKWTALLEISGRNAKKMKHISPG